MKTILVTGGFGQLATLIKQKSESFEGYKFLFVDQMELDITEERDVEVFFNNQTIDFCVNCAAYTAVDAAESNEAMALKVNAEGAYYLAKNCNEHGAKMVQLSTDFVFDGKKTSPYQEQDTANPLSVYGRSKLKGEILVAEALKEHFILRTSWLYSLEGHNFLKTMLKLGKDRDTLNVVNDQRGTPTYAGDLADVILHIIETGNKNYGLYHYSNEGSATWYEFAKSIFELANITVDLQPINTEEYPTPAKRPAYSVLDKSKVKTELRASVPEWEESLGKLLQPEKYSNCSA